MHLALGQTFASTSSAGQQLFALRKLFKLPPEFDFQQDLKNNIFRFSVLKCCTNAGCLC